MTQRTTVSDPRAQCWGKHQFQTPQLAFRVARKSRVPSMVYPCPHCGYFHIGHKQVSATAKPKLRVVT